MTQSMNSLMRQGLISAGAKSKLAVLRGTRAQKTKMVTFDGRKKDEGGRKDHGEVPNREINHPTNQSDRIGSKPSKIAGRATGFMAGKPNGKSRSRQGGGIGKRESQVSRGQIDSAEMQGPRFPAGAGYVGKGAAGKNTRMKGPIRRTGGPGGQVGQLYGGASKRMGEGG